MDSLPARLAQATTVSVAGTWQRHVAARHANSALDGWAGTGRWGTEDGYPVLYLGKPAKSVVVEAYRHLIDPVVGSPAPPIRPRVLITCELSVSEILDLRSAANRVLAELTLSEMQSETRDKAAYASCQNVSAAAHQLGYHGLIAPAATQMGETLVLFTDLIPEEERPIRTAEEAWLELPPDPRKPPQDRRLTVVR